MSDADACAGQWYPCFDLWDLGRCVLVALPPQTPLGALRTRGILTFTIYVYVDTRRGALVFEAGPGGNLLRVARVQGTMQERLQGLEVLRGADAPIIILMTTFTL